MNKHTQHAAWMALLLIAAGGCNSQSSSNDAGGADMDDLARMLDERPASAPDKPAVAKTPTAERSGSDRADTAAAEGAQPPAQAAPPAATRAAEPTPPKPQYSEPEKVTKFDPKRGRVFHNQPGYFNVLFSARFLAENSMTLNKIRHAMELYRAGEGNGEYPKSHEEFMRVIIEREMIELPELRDNFEYWYNAEEGQLMMRKPITEDSSQ